MAFLNNSGDIILDVVLTDEGRKRLAKGDGSFKFVKFSVGDDEINYGLYDSSNPNGSAYYDLDILQTPVFEALTDNAIALKYPLVSINRTNLLYLPILKINDKIDPATQMYSGLNKFVVCVDEETENEFSVDSSNVLINGILKGENAKSGGYIRIDQGLDTSSISPEFKLDSDLLETQYMITIDSRLGSIVDNVNGELASVNYVDDDYISSYFLSLNTDSKYVELNTDTSTSTGQVIAGSRGTILKFRIKSSIDLNSSTYLFEQIGVSAVTDSSFSGKSGIGINYYYIDSLVRVVGGSLGNTVDIPVRFVKLA